jgi:ABC-2 type transport system permease protein
MASRNLKKQSLLQLFLLLLILVFANIVAGSLFTRFDLTSEKRYSLSASTKKIAGNLKDVVLFKIYLDGDLPPGFKRLRNSTQELLDEYRIYSGDNIQYEFIDPSSNPDEKERIQLYKQLSEKGLTPTNLEERDKDSRSQRLVFPGAIVSYKSRSVPLQLLKSKIGTEPEVMLNNSIEGLEYEITSTIRRLTNDVAQGVAFLQGQEELNTRQITDIAKSLSEFYSIDTVTIDGRLDALKNYKALIIAKPMLAFTEKDKFIIDQFIMHGGRVLWLIDRMEINMDSLVETSTNIAIANDLNLDDQLFHYGVRVNPNLVMDLQAAPIPIVTGMVGNQPKQDLFPWFYFPLLNPISKHPIVNNLNAIKGEFMSTVDTVEAENIKKTILLTTSKYSKVQFPPARVSLNILRDQPDQLEYNKLYLPVAVLLEGTFHSNFTNRIPSTISEAKEIGFKATSDTTKMIVVSDGDIAASHVSKKGTIYPLGYDRYTQQTFGNKNFILNCVDYLCDDSGILELRGKEFKLRLLDTSKTENPGLLSWTNVLLPVTLVFLYGLIRIWLRKKKYTR